MSGILFVRCDASETFGVAPAAVRGAGSSVREWDAIDADDPRPSLDDVDGVVVFGSTFNVGARRRAAVHQGDRRPDPGGAGSPDPFLGVCFGGQLLAWALDAAVGEGPVREIGFEPIHPTEAAAHDRLFSHLTDGDMGFQWHRDAFDLPEGATLLASGDRVPNQAFRVGELAWGTQFHCEVNRAELEYWLEEFAKVGDLLTDWGKSSEEVRAEADRLIADHESRGHEVFERFALLTMSP